MVVTCSQCHIANKQAHIDDEQARIATNLIELQVGMVYYSA